MLPIGVLTPAVLDCELVGGGAGAAAAVRQGSPVRLMPAVGSGSGSIYWQNLPPSLEGSYPVTVPITDSVATGSRSPMQFRGVKPTGAQAFARFKMQVGAA